MRTSKLSALFIAAALAAAPTASAFADSTPVTESAPVRAEARDVDSDATRYAAREAKDRSVADFKGGESTVVIIGTSTLVLVLVVLLVLILI